MGEGRRERGREGGREDLHEGVKPFWTSGRCRVVLHAAISVSAKTVPLAHMTSFFIHMTSIRSIFTTASCVLFLLAKEWANHMTRCVHICTCGMLHVMVDC